MNEHILILRKDGVITVTMARPDKKNAITQAMYRAMAGAIEDYGKDKDARALILTGQGDMFTSGNDLHDFALGTAKEGEVPAVLHFLGALRDCPKPIIASVNGPAIGVGLTMLLHCDLVYASDSATFSAPFAKLALVPEAGSSMLLPACVGMAIANDILLAGRTLGADEALSFGLVARLFGGGELAQTVSKIACGIAGQAPNAMKKSKALIRNNRNQVAVHMAAEAGLFEEQLNSPEFAECLSAMMAKRQPVYG